ncbi:MAG: iron-sulfur cluster-binding protein [Chloroflexi bacterium]|nr:iron-sulfur cluster-binding protein [Ardenticatenaceae bacterium]MBL1130609.1 iron-sulfur cluster-binding protein [Chloroflexota bacterium]NOG36701.1 iron-sulfur cluster-binding protein [Chloroflexota bacterium]
MSNPSSATMSQFRHSATVAIADIQLQGALTGATNKFVNGRITALTELPHANALRDHFKKIRSATLANLAHYLELFEERATTAGSQIHWAQTGQDAVDIVLNIARQHGVKLVTKSKSMVTEEIHLNAALEANGITPVETDLGEWIIQLAGEPPSHIIGPAIHKTRHQVAELFSKEVGRPLPADDIDGLTAEARRLLRTQFLAAGLGISGGNLAIAETGTLVLVTNEGNGRLVTSAPPVHIAIIGIEKICPDWDAAATWLALLARSATGQPMSIYTTAITGPRRANDPDGPEEVHIILLDNGRSQLAGTPYEEILQCIRCGACLNVCPVYKKAGGHAYGSPYSGPIGAVVTPLLFGLEEYAALPQASTLCGACKDACPARIDLPRMLLQLRQDEVAARLLPWRERKAEEFAAFVLGREGRMNFFTKLGRWGQRPFQHDDGLKLPVNVGDGRTLPSLAPKPFRQLWDEGAVE